MDTAEKQRDHEEHQEECRDDDRNDRREAGGEPQHERENRDD
jgi:hypothetical protein